MVSSYKEFALICWVFPYGTLFLLIVFALLFLSMERILSILLHVTPSNILTKRKVVADDGSKQTLLVIQNKIVPADKTVKYLWAYVVMVGVVVATAFSIFIHALFDRANGCTAVTMVGGWDCFSSHGAGGRGSVRISCDKPEKRYYTVRCFRFTGNVPLALAAAWASHKLFFFTVRLITKVFQLISKCLGRCCCCAKCCCRFSFACLYISITVTLMLIMYFAESIDVDEPVMYQGMMLGMIILPFIYSFYDISQVGKKQLIVVEYDAIVNVANTYQNTNQDRNSREEEEVDNHERVMNNSLRRYLVDTRPGVIGKIFKKKHVDVPNNQPLEGQEVVINLDSELHDVSQGTDYDYNDMFDDTRRVIAI